MAWNLQVAGGRVERAVDSREQHRERVTSEPVSVSSYGGASGTCASGSEKCLVGLFLNMWVKFTLKKPIIMNSGSIKAWLSLPNLLFQAYLPSQCHGHQPKNSC